MVMLEPGKMGYSHMKALLRDVASISDSKMFLAGERAEKVKNERHGEGIYSSRDARMRNDKGLGEFWVENREQKRAKNGDARKCDSKLLKYNGLQAGSYKAGRPIGGIETFTAVMTRENGSSLQSRKTDRRD